MCQTNRRFRNAPFCRSNPTIYNQPINGKIIQKPVWFVRHGESQANAGLATIKADTIPLTSNGAAQAARVADWLPAPPALIVVSPYLRAKQTAEPSIRRFPAARVEEWPVHEFTYLAVDGETTAADRRPRVVDYWQGSDPNLRDGADVESFAEFINRARTTLTNLKRADDSAIAVFTHGQFIRALMWLVLTDPKVIDPSSMKEFYSFLCAVPFPNAGVIEFAFASDRAFLGAITDLSSRAPESMHPYA